MYLPQMTDFFSAVGHDNRISYPHIVLYMALFECWNKNEFNNPISISRSQIMKLSKINSKSTYHKYMKDLTAFGYINYSPSYHPILGTTVYLKMLAKD
jgi:hypothetical protein